MGTLLQIGTMALSPAHITYMAASGENEKNLTIRDPKTIHSESYLVCFSIGKCVVSDNLLRLQICRLDPLLWE